MRVLRLVLLALSAACAVFGQLTGPFISSISPSTVEAAGTDFDLTITGPPSSAFSTAYRLRWNGSVYYPSCLSLTQLKIRVSAAMIAAPGEVTIAVEDANGAVSNSVTLTITSPTPQLTSVQPIVIAAGSADAYLNLQGAKFTSVATAYWNGSAIPTRFSSASQLYATVPGSIRSPGTVSVTVANPGNAVSNGLNVRVYQPSVISSLQPASVPIGSPGFTLTIAGSGFADDSVVRWDSTPLPTVFVNSGALAVQIAASAVASAGSHTISVAGSNASGNTLAFVITGVTPSIISCNLTTLDLGSGYVTFPLTVYATGIAGGAVVKWAGTSLTTSGPLVTPLPTDKVYLYAPLPLDLARTAGEYEVTIMNPGGEVSSPYIVTVRPGLTGVLPHRITAGTSRTITVLGSGFSDSSVVEITPPGGGPTALPTTYVPSYSVTASLSPSLLTAPGTASVQVREGNVRSASTPLTISPPPKITSLSPTSIQARTWQPNVTVTGDNFISGCSIRWNGTQISTPLADSMDFSPSLVATIPASLLATAGAANIDVDCSGSISNAVTLTITRAAPGISAINPLETTVGGPDLSLRITGYGFEQTSVAYCDQTALSTTYLSSTELEAVLPAALTSISGTPLITVFNPPAGTNDRSESKWIYVRSTLTSITPTETAPPFSDVVITLRGTGFSPTERISVYDNGWVYGPLETTYIDSTTLRGLLPATWITQTVNSNRYGYTISSSHSTGSGLPFQIKTFALGSINPWSVVSGGPSFILKANGVGFTAGATVNWNGTDLPTTFVSSTQLEASVAASYYAYGGGSAMITVRNGNGSISRGLTLTIEPPPPTAPVLYGPTPSSAYVGSPDLEVQIRGAKFVSGAIVKWNSAPLATTFVDDTSLKAVIPASLQKAPGSAAITVTNPDGQVSGRATFTVEPVTVYFISPNSIAAGGGQFTLTVSGNGFAEDGVVQCNGTSVQTTYVSSGQLRATVPSQLIASAGTVLVSVLTRGYGTETKALSVFLQPSISALAPGQVDAPGPGFTLTVFGAGLLKGSTVYWGTTPLSTAHVTDAELKATVPATLVAFAQDAAISVKLAEGPATSTMNFYVRPTVTSLTPGSTYRNGADVAVTMKGVGFPPDADLIFYDTVQGIRWILQTTYRDATTVTGLLSNQVLKRAQSTRIYLQSTAWPSLPFEVIGGFFIGSISPMSAVKGSPDLALHVLLATNASSTSVVRWSGTPLATTAYSTELTATVPAALLTSAGTVTVDVKAANGSTTNAVTFEVYDPGPSISSIDPAYVYTSDKPADLTVNGSGFVQGSEVQLNGAPLATAFVSEARLTAVIPATELAWSRTAAVTARNPGTGRSPSVGFAIRSRPSLISVWPATVLAGAPPFTLSVQGNFFESGSEVLWDGVPLETTFDSSYTLKAEVATANLSKPGTSTITVRLANGTASSNSTAVRVSGLSMTSLTPASARPGGPGFVLTVTGADFSKFSTVRWGNQTLDTAFTKSTELTAYVPASLIASPGIGQITVVDGSLVTNPVQFTISDFSITVVTPSQIDAAGPGFTLDVRGQGILAGAKIHWAGIPLETTIISQNQAQAVVPAALIATAAVCPISIVNLGGQTSGDYTVYVNPVLSSVTPASAPKGSDPAKITVRGAGFASSNYIQFSAFGTTTALSTVYFDSTTLTTTIPANLLTESTQAEITVRGPLAARSKGLTFAVGNAPLIQSLSPENVTYGGPAFTLTVDGSGFVSGATVRWNQSSLATTYINGTQLTAAVPASLIAGEPTGGATIDVLNPNGTASNSYAFHIVPALTSLEPSGAAVGSPSFLLMATGAGFRSGDTIRWNGTQLGTSFVTSTSLTATVPASLLTIPITASVTVGAGDSISQALPFPVTSGSVPASSSAGIVNAASYQTSVAPGSAISIFGSNLASGEAKADGLPLPKMLNSTSVLINGSAAPLFYVSPGQVNAQVPFETPLGTASLVAQVDGRSSAPVQFQVVAAAPGVFSIFDTNHAIAQNYPDWSLNSAQNPAAPGQYVTVYLTGVGRVDNPVEAGKPAPSEPLSRALGEVKVKVGGKAAEVPYAGLTPGFVGLAQVNLIVPPDAPPGEQPLEITIGGVASNLTLLSIKAVR